MIDKIKNIFTIPELRERILFTIGVLVIVRIGAHIPIPGVNGEALSGAFADMKNTLFGLFNTFVGGAFQKASLFSLGIMPYISSSIIIQLMGSVVLFSSSFTLFL
jgi:preprotein translocase subunit SecY